MKSSFFRAAIMFVVLVSMSCSEIRGFNQDQNSAQLTLPSAIESLAYYASPGYSVVFSNPVYSSKSLPTWLSLNTSTGELSGLAPSSEQRFEFDVTASENGDHERFNLVLEIESADKYRYETVKDFYAIDMNDQARVYRNDLTGSLSAEIQIVQSHASAPNGNVFENKEDQRESRYMPRPVALRESLVLVIPHNDIRSQTFFVDITHNGKFIARKPLNAPALLPKSDFKAGTEFAYSTKAWWFTLPWDSVRNGLALTFSAGELTGTLSADKIEFGDATQLVLQTIRVGMLAEPPKSNNNHYFSNDPVAAAADYFQTLPVSRLVVANYADVKFDKVMIASGKIYDSVSDDNGNVYSGDMRSNVAKSQVSVGINMANFGHTSHDMSQKYRHQFKQITNHHAQGNYQNGVVHHGLSGGNGIGTLYSTAGNEASHEWGHAYGLGHYPGKGLTDDGRWARHHRNSGWGYIAHRNRMRASIDSINEDGSLNFLRDAMSGGYSNSSMSRYTYYTGYTAVRIQKDLERHMVPDADFETGYKQWNGEKGAFIDALNKGPVPTSVGVPVATILGAYDVSTNTGVLYPVLYGNYGNLFDLPAPDVNSSQDQCWVEIKNESSQSMSVAIAPFEHKKGEANQLHFNVPLNFRPTSGQVQCQRNGKLTVLASMKYGSLESPLPPVGFYGQGEGLSELKTNDFAKIEAALTSMPETAVVMSDNLKAMIDVYDKNELIGALSVQTASQLIKLLEHSDAIDGINIMLNHARENSIDPASLLKNLKQQLQQSQLLRENAQKPAYSAITAHGLYFDVAPDNQLIELAEVPSDQAAMDEWIMDKAGRIHWRENIRMCLTPVGSAQLKVSQCSLADQNQQWSYNAQLGQLKNQNNGQCLDYDKARKRLIRYRCSGAWNQSWQGVKSYDQPWLGLLTDDALELAKNALEASF